MNFISTISVIGVTIGVAALILVLSVYNGFSELVTTLLMEFDPHLRIEAIKRTGTNSYTPILQRLYKMDSTLSCAPYVSGKALLVAKNVNKVVTITGMDTQMMPSVSGVQGKIILGNGELHEHGFGIIIGFVLADRLGVVVGDTLAVLSPVGAEIAALQLGLPHIRKFHVIGIYESNNKDYDSFFAFTDLSSAQTLFSTKELIDGYDIRFKNPYQAEDFKDELFQEFGDTFRVMTWFDLHRELYTVMQIERWGAYIILCMIIVVASFNLLGSLTMTVIQKQRDIGILKAMGVSNQRIAKIFRLQGLFVGIVGTFLGYCIGYLLIFLQQRYHLFPLDPTVYIIPAIPVKAKIFDFIVVGTAAIGFCSIASIIPSKRAASVLPARALRWE
ncbi:MAG: ABC transporter permease [Bacteroidetes bacterium]|nr:ABC transporter permease [Bacteroidota bacterium]